jgi:hypothetical protein
VEILKYIDKKVGEIEKQKNNKEMRIGEIKDEIKKLENKVNTETEKESVIVKSEAKIKVLKNRMKIIELETIEELDKEYIKSVADKDIQKLSSDLGERNKKILKKVYYLLEEIAENQEQAETKHSTLRIKLYANQIQGYFSGQFEQGGRLRELYKGSLEIKKNNQWVSLEKNESYGSVQKLTIAKKDVE